MCIEDQVVRPAQREPIGLVEEAFDSASSEIHALYASA
jgi:hypothetical protein